MRQQQNNSATNRVATGVAMFARERRTVAVELPKTGGNVGPKDA